MRVGCLLIFKLILVFSLYSNTEQQILSEKLRESKLLNLLKIDPCEESIDYVATKKQFQLHTLLTEQRHNKTWDLSHLIQKDYQKALSMLFSVDEDIVEKLEELSKEKKLDQMISETQKAILSGNKIYVYGCGATGRLAKQIESNFWRPFWNNIRTKQKIWKKIKNVLGEDIEERLIGEITGADRALISSLEGFEDLLLIGKMQLEDRKINKGDIVISVTEGGETSSVIGTILAALNQWKTTKDYSPENSRKNLYFICNNPNERLNKFDRCKKVIDERGITKINLTSGPQSITGSTRMQATTIEIFVIANAIQKAIENTLRKFLSFEELVSIGFEADISFSDKLKEFSKILNKVKEKIPSIAKLTELETKTYESKKFTTYFATKGLMTVFTDSTERSPTFRLLPLDRVNQKERECWIQVWTSALTKKNGWQLLLGRPFKGMELDFYKDTFENNISDYYLRKKAAESLTNAQNDQQELYDFSFSNFNIENRCPRENDLGIIVLLNSEEKEIKNDHSILNKFMQLLEEKKAKTFVIFVTSEKDSIKFLKEKKKLGEDSFVVIDVDEKNDPFGVNQQVALKILLNAHSTAVMTKLGKVIGNTMTNVSPSNLKLIGRATYLIQSHVNDILQKSNAINSGLTSISYAEANAVLFDSINFLKNSDESKQIAEVAFSIIRILESLSFGKPISYEEVIKILKESDLNRYLFSCYAKR